MLNAVIKANYFNRHNLEKTLDNDEDLFCHLDYWTAKKKKKKSDRLIFAVGHVISRYEKMERDSQD